MHKQQEITEGSDSGGEQQHDTTTTPTPTKIITKTTQKNNYLNTDFYVKVDNSETNNNITNTSNTISNKRKKHKTSTPSTNTAAECREDAEILEQVFSQEQALCYEVIYYN